MEKTIRTIRKSQGQKIHVGLSEYTKDGEMFDMAYARVYFDDGAEYRPTRNGLNIRVCLLPALIAALQQAEAEARSVGLLKEDETTATAPIGATEATRAAAGEGDLTILGGG